MNGRSWVLFCVLGSIFFTACTGLQLQGSDNLQDEAVWQEMYDCVKEARENPAKAACDSRFKDTVVTGRLRKITSNYGSFDLDLTIKPAGSFGVSHDIACGVNQSKYKEQVAKMSPGDLVSVKGMMSQAFTSSYFISISLRPCEIVEQVPDAQATDR